MGYLSVFLLMRGCKRCYNNKNLDLELRPSENHNRVGGRLWDKPYNCGPVTGLPEIAGNWPLDFAARSSGSAWPGYWVSLRKLRGIKEYWAYAPVDSAVFWNHIVHQVMPGLRMLTWSGEWLLGMHSEETASFIQTYHLLRCEVLLRGPKSITFCLSLDNVAELSVSWFLSVLQINTVFEISIYHNSVVDCKIKASNIEGSRIW